MTGISSMAQALSQLDRIKIQQGIFDDLSTQMATGKKTQRFSVLSTELMVSKRARADFGSTEKYLNNIQNANRRIDLTLRAIEEFQTHARDFSAALVNFSKESTHQEGEIVYYDDPLTPEEESIPIGVDSDQPDIDFKILRNMASNLYGFMTDLMNIQDGDRYLLSGADTLSKPLEDNGLIDSALSSLITGWKGGTVTTSSLIADLTGRTTSGGNTDALTDSIVGYSAALSAGNVENIHIRVREGSDVEYTVLANEQAFRDVLVGLSWVKNESLPPIADTYLPGDPAYPAPPSATGAPGETLEEMKENFFDVFTEVMKMVNNAVSDIDSLRFKLENVKSRLASITADHQQDRNLLLDTISNVEDADINEVAVKISTLQIQLDASYRITAGLRDLSLANFL
ncbi:MAG: hypothetical protein K9G62_08440 [Alphaproteobacteria bacterium]|nr:hypothetical protein [Alphaproteobacteria bacterium]